MTHAERMARFDKADLYVVITEAFCAGRCAVEVLDAVLAAGVNLVQLREKDLEDRDLYRRATAFRNRTAAAGALLVVNNRVDIALAVGADGVHLGQDDLPLEAALRISGELIVGCSTHDPVEAEVAQAAGASYVNIGPVFPTRTKAVSAATVGPEMIERIAPRLRIPWTTMGGINLSNVGEVVRRGARHVAVVTAVTAAADPCAAARGLREAILAGR
jgi:thiamine-phosphate pyrophosphorylase